MVGEITRVQELRQLLLTILETAFQENGDVVAKQQLGVSVSNAIKKDGGVLVIQNQNVEVYARIVPSMVKAIRICDMIDEQPIKLLPTPMSEPTVVDSVAGDPVDDCCKYLLSKGTKWEDMQEIVKSRYLKHVVEMAGKKSEAAKWLGIGPTYICKLLKQHNGGS